MKYVIITWLALALGSVALAQVRQGAWTPVAESFERGYSSISYWTYRDDGVEIGGGRISVEHGKPQWDAMLDEPATFDAATIGKLWRLGNNKWTILDTQLKLDFGERVVEPGIYYLVLDRPSAEEWQVVFVAPDSVRPGPTSSSPRVTSASAVSPTGSKNGCAKRPRWAAVTTSPLASSIAARYMTETDFAGRLYCDMLAGYAIVHVVSR